MRVCLVSEFPSGSGAALAATRLAAGLVKQGVEVHVVYLYHRDPIPTDDGVVYHNLQEHRSWKNNLYSKLNLRIAEKMSHVKYRGSLMQELGRSVFLDNCYLTNYRDLSRFLQKIKPDIINLHNCSLFIGHREVKQLGREFPVFWTMHDCMATNGFSYLLKLPGGEKMYRPSIEYTTNTTAINGLIILNSNVSFVAPSKWLYKKAKKVIKGQKPLHHIPYGQDSSVFYPENKDKARREVDLKENEKLQIFSIASRLDNVHKNLSVIFKALENKELSQQVQLNLAGDMGEDRAGLPKAVNLLPRTSDPVQLRKYYSAADITIVPSLIDNLPNTVMESLYCGTPVIGSRRGGIPDMVVPGESGWLFNPVDPRDLISRIDHCLNNRDELSRLQQNCSSWAQEMFSDEKQALSYINLFQKGLASHG